MQSKLTDDFTDEDKIQQSSQFWNYKEEKEIIGLFIRWEKDGYGEHAVLDIGEEEELHLPNLTALNSKLRTADIQTNQKVKVVFVEEVKSKKSGRVYADFDIFVK